MNERIQRKSNTMIKKAEIFKLNIIIIDIEEGRGREGIQRCRSGVFQFNRHLYTHSLTHHTQFILTFYATSRAALL